MLFITFLFFIFISRSSSSLYFPFKTVEIKRNISQNDPEYNISHYVNDHFYVPSFITIKMGSTYQDSKFLIVYDESGFKIEKSKYCIKDDINYLSVYDKNKSSDFKFMNNTQKRREKLCEDSMQFFTEIDLKNLIKYEGIKFYLNSEVNESPCGIIGLKYDSFKLYSDDITSIFESLKLKKLIKNETWMIKYTSQNEGLFIVSPDLTKIYQDFDENKLFTTYRDKKGANTWNILITKVLSENNNSTINKKPIKGIINNDLDLIEGDGDYYEYITLSYFKPYIKKRICKLEEITVNYYYYFVLECHKKNFTLDDMKKFPTLTLVLTSLNSEFVFDYKDVFVETKYKYFFNIVFNKFVYTNWIFGKPVLKKYPLLINYEAETVSFYNESFITDNNRTNDDINNKNKISAYVFIISGVIIIIMAAILGSVLYFIIIYKNKFKKKRANELLDDNFDYTPSKDSNNNDEKFNNIIND